MLTVILRLIRSCGSLLVFSFLYHDDVYTLLIVSEYILQQYFSDVVSFARDECW